MNAKLIVIDGKTYHSVEEMPPDIRQKYEQAMRSLGDANDNHIPDALESMNIFADKDKNGVPDLLENPAAGNVIVNSMRIIVDNKEFDGIDNLPPEARARYEQAMSKLDANRNGIPDFIEGMTNITDQTTNMTTGFGAETPFPQTPMPADPAITPDTTISNGWLLALVGVFLFLFCAAGVWYFFLR